MTQNKWKKSFSSLLCRAPQACPFPVHGYMTLLQSTASKLPVKVKSHPYFPKATTLFIQGSIDYSKDSATSKSQLDKSISCETPPLT